MKRVFIVEDEGIVAMELADHVRAMGHEVCGHAARGDAALREIPLARPDLVLMDINLGKGLSGLDVVEQLRTVIDVPVIFLTAFSNEEFTRRAGRSGSFMYLVKPFEPRVLRANMELALVRHEVTTALRVSEARFRALFEQAAVGVAEIDTETGRFVRVNRKYCELLGWSVVEMLTLDFMAVTHPDDLGADLAQMERLKQGELREFTLEKRYLRKDGEVVWVSLAVSPLWAPGEAPTRHMAVVNDITARKRAEARFAGVFESSPDAVLIVGERGRVVLANRMAETTLGYSRAELLGLTVEDLVPEDVRAGHAPQREGFLMRQGSHRMGASRLRLFARRKDGSRVPVEISLSPLASEEGRLVVAAVRDVSARVRAEEERDRLQDQLRHAQKMESLGTLAGGIAHDFNNLLAAIIANVEFAQREAVSGEVAESLEEISAASSRAGELVKRILTFSRQHPSRPESRSSPTSTPRRPPCSSIRRRSTRC
jgi:PAS domain S-box-containing protein